MSKKSNTCPIVPALILIPILLISSCVNQTPKNTISGNRIVTQQVIPDTLLNINIDTLPIAYDIKFSSIFKSVKLIPLETKPECLIGYIDQIQVYNDRIYILDSTKARSLMVFNMDGTFIRKIGSKGRGRGEYLSPSVFAINKTDGTIHILDRRSNRIICYTTNGEIVKEFKLSKKGSVSQFTILDNAYFFSLTPSYKRPTVHLMLKQAINSKTTVNIFPLNTHGLGFNQPINYSMNFYQGNNDVKYTRILFDTIYSITDDRIKPFITINTSNKITPSDIDEMNSYKTVSEYTRNYHSTCEKYLGMNNYLENDKLIHFKIKNHKVDHTLIIQKKNGQIFYSPRLKDDLGHTKFMKLYATYNDYVVGTPMDFMGQSIPRLLENINKNNLNLSEINRQHLKELLTPESNPVIYFYETK
ncbi:6-bladed beta-propeller [Puteibacter caeruleilacunae]|nr:6-bladed beta-propeller [Puteibacter caeruleilacunae]